MIQTSVIYDVANLISLSSIHYFQGADNVISSGEIRYFEWRNTLFREARYVIRGAYIN